MNALYGPTIPPTLMSELAMHLRNTGSMLTAAQAATQAIRAWMGLRLPGERYYLPASRRRREQERVAVGLPANPAAKLLKKQAADVAARNAEKVATSQTAVASPNAPSRDTALEVVDATANHAQTVAAAAVTMSEALKTMLTLMERLSAPAMPDDDRRINPARRQDDILADACAAD